MDLHLNEEQEMIRKMAREFAQKEVAPIAAEIDEQARVPLENVRKMGEIGFLGLTVPEAYGGAGADTVAYVVAVEEISRVCASTAAIMSVHNSLVCQGLDLYGSEAQKQTYLPRLAAGQMLGA
ncbi:MAG: acyl-CoA dehydrogenase family protein, partial [Anaerolineae bacterium]|nr:acyl-CoA dehydrogenase family protein [Anaerolineae bacterium]